MQNKGERILTIFKLLAKGVKISLPRKLIETDQETN